MTQDTQLPLDLGMSDGDMPASIMHSRDLRAKFVASLPDALPTEMRRLLDHAFTCGAASHTEQVRRAFSIGEPRLVVGAIAALDLGASEELRLATNRLAPSFAAPEGDSSHAFNYGSDPLQ
jgi:hypothetical protein